MQKALKRVLRTGVCWGWRYTGSGYESLGLPCFTIEV